jgi:hypothetical protein
VVIVSHREPRVEVWSRAAHSEEWTRNEARAGEHAVIPTLDCTLDVEAIWRAAVEPICVLLAVPPCRSGKQD